jgi:hypothetical protein
MTEGTILAIVGMACLSVVATAAVLRDVVLALLERKRTSDAPREVHIHHHTEPPTPLRAGPYEEYLAGRRRSLVGPAPPAEYFTQPSVVRPEVALGPAGPVDHGMYDRLAQQ